MSLNRGPFEAICQLGRSRMTEGKARMWYGALAFWLVVACLLVARIILLDPSKLHPSYAVSASDAPTLAGQRHE
jgi:hypothetical protein